jgi:cytochrome c-type biogenesis protein CcmH
MRAQAFPIAVGALLALAALLVVMVLRPDTAMTHDDLAHRIASELRCPDCQGLSVADSTSPSALEIRRQIDALVAKGRSADEVRQTFVDRYGEWILLTPSAPTAWLLPLGVVATMLLMLAAWLWRGRGRSPRLPDGAVGASERARAQEEAEALDA